jgi:hypothetical protein
MLSQEAVVEFVPAGTTAFLHGNDEHAALRSRVVPLVVFDFEIALTGPLKARGGNLEPRTITGSTILFAAADFVDDPWL